ncbi:MAG: UDP-N-acetylglucosamine 1-carboxyvinyltransferase, partial [Anaerolineales bacterium]
MEKFVIQGGIPINGEVTPSGNKNAALPLIAACLLTDEPVILRNVPEIRDVQTMRALIQSLGVEIKNVGDHAWRIHAKEVRPADLDPSLCQAIRASILLAGPMLARAGQLILPPPGGDVIGRRRVDTHILALQALSADCEFDREGRVYRFSAQHLKGANILLDEASVTATENAIMAAVMSSGETILRNAASEPHIQDLCHFLNHLGAKITNVGSNTLHIQGVPKLGGAEYSIGPDYLEVVSFIGAAAVTGGSLQIRNAAPQYLDMIRLVFHRLGVDWKQSGEDIL